MSQTHLQIGGLELLLDPPRAAQFLDIDTGTSANWRSRGVGLKYVKVENAIRYTLPHLREYLEARTRNPVRRHREVA